MRIALPPSARSSRGPEPGAPGGDRSRRVRGVVRGAPSIRSQTRRVSGAAGSKARAGSEALAQPAALAFQARLAELRARHAGRTPVRVFYEIWHQPLLTVNGEHMISDVIALCGGTNVFATVPLLTPVVTLEAVLHARPEVILGGSSSVTPRQFVAQWRNHAIDALSNIPAFFVAPDDIQRATPRILNGARVICRHLEQVRAGRNDGKRQPGAIDEPRRLR